MVGVTISIHNWSAVRSGLGHGRTLVPGACVRGESEWKPLPHDRNAWLGHITSPKLKGLFVDKHINTSAYLCISHIVPCPHACVCTHLHTVGPAYSRPRFVPCPVAIISVRHSPSAAQNHDLRISSPGTLSICLSITFHTQVMSTYL